MFLDEFWVLLITFNCPQVGHLYWFKCLEQNNKDSILGSISSMNLLNKNLCPQTFYCDYDRLSVLISSPCVPGLLILHTRALNSIAATITSRHVWSIPEKCQDLGQFFYLSTVKTGPVSPVFYYFFPSGWMPTTKFKHFGTATGYDHNINFFPIFQAWVSYDTIRPCLRNLRTWNASSLTILVVATPEIPSDVLHNTNSEQKIHSTGNKIG